MQKLLSTFKTSPLLVIFWVLICVKVQAQGPECPATADFNLMTPCYTNGSRADNPTELTMVFYNHVRANEGAVRSAVGW